MDDYIEVRAKTVDDAITEALLKLETTSDKIEYEVIDKGSSGFLGLLGAKPAVIRVRKKFNLVDNVERFLKDLFRAMNMEVDSQIDYNESDRTMNIVFSGDEMGILIGKRGQTLDSLQYIISLVVNKESDSYIRVKVDTENYRERRKETLETLAKNIAYKVKRSRRSVALEPMNPYERRIIHSALQNDRYVETHSEGEEPYRKVVVTLKRYNKEKRSSNN
ncbi:MAG TPA: protein jag [Candidatus Scybalocola faecigallinarum]|uniref:RNA-binding protein KhpB n=1 Tax=Candidatus Scybalocola faecigallinarum TaxID=2840941 RepID=A0A9D1JPZ6_9FIRM|nr:protein jag [Candidatus Scybalocola faecigallinarum]